SQKNAAAKELEELKLKKYYKDMFKPGDPIPPELRLTNPDILFPRESSKELDTEIMRKEAIASGVAPTFSSHKERIADDLNKQESEFIIDAIKARPLEVPFADWFKQVKEMAKERFDGIRKQESDKMEAGRTPEMEAARRRMALTGTDFQKIGREVAPAAFEPGSVESQRPGGGSREAYTSQPAKYDKTLDSALDAIKNAPDVTLEKQLKAFHGIINRGDFGTDEKSKSDARLRLKEVLKARQDQLEGKTGAESILGSPGPSLQPGKPGQQAIPGQPVTFEVPESGKRSFDATEPDKGSFAYPEPGKRLMEQTAPEMVGTIGKKAIEIGGVVKEGVKKASDVVGAYFDKGDEASSAFGIKQKSSEIFDPDGPGYDEKRGNELAKKYPLTIPKPDKYQGDYVTQKDAFQAWVWHPELKNGEGDYKKHGGSLDPESNPPGRSLKGKKHKTWDLSVKAEAERDSELVKGKDGFYYSVPKEKGPKTNKAAISLPKAPKMEKMQSLMADMNKALRGKGMKRAEKLLADMGKELKPGISLPKFNKEKTPKINEAKTPEKVMPKKSSAENRIIRPGDKRFTREKSDEPEKIKIRKKIADIIGVKKAGAATVPKMAIPGKDTDWELKGKTPKWYSDLEEMFTSLDEDKIGEFIKLYLGKYPNREKDLRKFISERL
ncbi:MAG: hypothetical protein ABIA67_01260, partial [Candidatus Margulisiibacteriota bacterium]